MKSHLRATVDASLERLREQGILPPELDVDYQLETPKNPDHGDFSVNAAMLLARPLKRPPREIAAQIIEQITSEAAIAEISIAGPGFINIRLSHDTVLAVVGEILEAGEKFGTHTVGRGCKVQIEFVSANPTGPLHVGHGRGAALGSVIANLFSACGYEVTREYYVNDAGRQMDILALSVYLRILQSLGRELDFPAAAYQGDYIVDIANSVTTLADDWPHFAAPDFSDRETPGDDEILDAWIAEAKAVMGTALYGELRARVKDIILDSIKSDLEAFGVEYDVWYSELSLDERGLIDDAVSVLESSGEIYLSDGAKWFKSSSFGDEKDRVVVRDNGQATYFASDIAYHLDKYRRGFDRIVNVWGADHHGYVPRVKGAVQALGEDPTALEIVLVQFAALVRGGEKLAMSTRSGEFVTLKQLVDDVGRDAARFFYVMRRADQHLEFDLDLAKAQSNDNPVYYLQYAHARICSVMKQLESSTQTDAVMESLAEHLIQPAERELAMCLSRFPEVVAQAARLCEPHLLTNYLRELATLFHGYYNAHRVLVDEPEIRDARVHLIGAVRIVLANGLNLLGLEAPQAM